MILVKPHKTNPRQGVILEAPTLTDVARFLPTCNSSKLLAFDYETTGLELDDTPVGVSIVDAANLGGVYFSFKNIGKELVNTILRRVSTRPSIAHNAQFEQQVTFSATNSYANIQYDTACLLNQIEGDYATGNKGLKKMQMAFLKWKEAGDVELDQWLEDNGYVTARGKVMKGEMWRAPDSILGHYCNMDAQSTWDLFQYCFAPILERFPELDVYHTRDFQNLIRMIDRARRTGLTVDLPNLTKHRDSLVEQMEELMRQFHIDSPATPFVKEYNNKVLTQHYEKMPNKLTKTGKPSTRFEKWSIKFEELKKVNHFNLNSKKQLAWLFYDNIFETEDVVEYTRWGAKREFTNIAGVGRVPKTKKGLRAIDKKILPKLGKAGEILAKYNKLNKELGYVEAMINTSPFGVHKPQLRVSGTKTDRCSGGSSHTINGETFRINLQQIPHSEGYLKCLGVERDGYVGIQMDINSLESVVLGELSECPGYMMLYGPGRPTSDVFLFVAAQSEEFAEEVAAAGFDYKNPTPEGIASAKKKCYRTRTICKIFSHSSNYGAGVDTIHARIKESNISMTKAEVQKLHDRFWEIFAGVKRYEDHMKSLWEANKGYFIDGLGCPVTVHPDCDKDILSRGIQKVGHMILVKFLYHLTQICPEFEPVLVDFHDETIGKCKKENVEKVLSDFDKAWELTNEELGGIIPLYGAAEVYSNFWDFKKG